MENVTGVFVCAGLVTMKGNGREGIGSLNKEDPTVEIGLVLAKDVS
jgi:hypothetical protein